MKNQSPSAHEYLVEMNFAPFATLPTPQEAATFAEKFALPTLEALEKLEAGGHIIAGGTNLAAVGFTFIARVATAPELEEMLVRLPLWGRAQTRILPLGTFASRSATLRARLAQNQTVSTPGRS